jgi:methyltransferase (TIGR00027 family)
MSRESKGESVSRRVENKVSWTAQGTLIVRAVSSKEKNQYYRCDDNIAPLLTPGFSNPLRRWLYRVVAKRIVSGGSYEQVIARTKYFDAVFQGIPGNVEQVVIYGAGFDSRAIRFRSQLANKRVFELDAPITQAAKIERLNRLNLEMPPDLVFVPIDFDKDSLERKLDEVGFQKGRLCLSLLEGLLQYLRPESVDEIFHQIEAYSSKGSILAFDYPYSSRIREVGIPPQGGIFSPDSLGARLGEKLHFGIEKGGIEPFLLKYGFQLVDESDSPRLEKRFFTDNYGRLVAHIRGTRNILVTAIKA